MNVAPLKTNAQSADVPLERLAHNASLSEEQKVGEVARQFEAVLLRQILAETQKTVVHSNLTDDSTTSGIYHDMVTSQLADSISKSGALGLSQSLEYQLNRQARLASPAGHDQPAGALPTAHPGRDAARPGQSRRAIARILHGQPPIFETEHTAH